MTLDDAARNIGRGVVYRPVGAPVEQGLITFVNNQYVFVRYGSDIGSKATSPQLLEFLS